MRRSTRRDRDREELRNVSDEELEETIRLGEAANMGVFERWLRGLWRELMDLEEIERKARRDQKRPPEGFRPPYGSRLRERARECVELVAVVRGLQQRVEELEKREWNRRSGYEEMCAKLTRSIDECAAENRRLAEALEELEDDDRD